MTGRKELSEEICARAYSLLRLKMFTDGLSTFPSIIGIYFCVIQVAHEQRHLIH